MMIMYDYDSNAILCEQLKTRQGKELANAFTKLCEKINIDTMAQNLFILDNECPGDVKYSINDLNATYQLAPPHQHRRNTAENAIKTFKSNFLSGLATCDKNFPITEWDWLLPQAELT